MSTFGPYQATVVRVVDGDTIVVDVDLGFNVHLAAQSVRFFGCNADEHDTPGGKAAIAWLETMVKPGDVVQLTSHGWDKYGGRVDGSITLADGTDLVAAEIAAGHAAAWDGKGAKPTT